MSNVELIAKEFGSERGDICEDDSTILAKDTEIVDDSCLLNGDTDLRFSLKAGLIFDSACSCFHCASAAVVDTAQAWNLISMAQQNNHGTQPATQQATQPYDDPRRRGRNLSEMSDGEAADLLCVLHANSPAAHRAIRATMLATPEHILQNDDLDGITADDLQLYPDIEKRTRDVALRMSSTVKVPKDGFRFGRNPDVCDILLTADPNDKTVSNTHFKIFVNSHGSLMIQDVSTNGTIVDDRVLRSKDRTGHAMTEPATRVLESGSIISVLSGSKRQEVKWLVRTPNRNGYEDLYGERLRKYLSIRGKKPLFTSIRESSLGNNWNGGNVYNFTGLLGKGAFAMVYRVQTKNEGTVFAAKEIDKRRFIKNNILDTKFDNELKIMRSLKHPNIVDYVDCQWHENWIYIIMEYLPHGELSKELETRGLLPEHEVQQITRQTLRALDYLHRQGIAHRDIKPDNILIASRDPLVVKLSDFGLSKTVVDQETFLKTFCGTLLYCAPEVYPDYGTYASGEKKRRRYGEPPSKTAPYDSSADMWSFGAVVFHLLCGKPPVKGRGDDRGAQMLSNIMTKEIDFGPLHDAGVSDLGVDFVATLLNRNPSMRPTERDCFEHPWLRQVPDLFEYEDAAEEKATIARNLEDLEELDEEEADEDLINDLNELTQVKGLVGSPPSPDRPVKKPKMIREGSGIPAEILYPDVVQPKGSQNGPKLFGEITPSLLKSSGVFGRNVSTVAENDLPQIRNQMEQVSMNDFGALRSHPANEVSADISGQPLQYPQTLAAPVRSGGSAASLLGAEAQMGHMQVGSMAWPENAPSDVATPETTNPVTPQTRDLSPSNSAGKSAGSDSGSHRSQSDEQSRRIDIDLLSNEKAFAEAQKQRQAVREENARLKAETFQIPFHRGSTGGSSIEALVATDIGRGREVQSAGPEKLYKDSVERRISLSTHDTTEGNEALFERYGKLTPLVGSFSSDVISLTARSTLWGRSPLANARYSDVQDLRVPKFGMKIIFYAPGIEKVEANGEDWTQVPGLRTVIATSARQGIQINGLTLHQESKDGSAALFGKIYSGDVITIKDDRATGAVLKYLVEIVLGDSAQPRPAKEQPFEIQREYDHHAVNKQRNGWGITVAS